MAFDKTALLARVKATGEDMTKPQVFEGGTPIHELIPEGTHRARLVGYIEIGKQNAVYKGEKKIENQVVLQFEITGPRIKPREDGAPHIIELRPMSKSLNEKAKFFKLFQRLNWAGKATHIAELMGDAYLVGVYHRKGVGKDGKERVYIDFNKKGEPLDFRRPMVEDVETGEFTPVKVEPARTPEKLFLWDFADMDQWESIFIDGTWAERKNEAGEVVRPALSKNFLQNKIKVAINFKGSPIEQLLLAGGVELDIPDAERVMHPDAEEGADEDAPATNIKAADVVPTGQAAADALSGIV